VVEDLCNRFCKDATVGIAYFYCNFRQQDEQKVEDLIANLLKQLAESQPSFPRSVTELYNRHNDPHHKVRRTRPLLNETLSVLQHVVAMYSRVFIVVDALDECQASDGCRSTFLANIFDLQVKSGANIFATSRFIPEIIEKFKASPRLEIRASNEDVQKYVDGRISKAQSRVLQRHGLREKIKEEIVNAVDGM